MISLLKIVFQEKIFYKKNISNIKKLIVFIWRKKRYKNQLILLQTYLPKKPLYLLQRGWGGQIFIMQANGCGQMELQVDYITKKNLDKIILKYVHPIVFFGK